MRVQILNWLEAPTPDSPNFSMNWGLAEITDPELDPVAGPRPPLGIICCIAGFAALHSGVHPWTNESAPFAEISTLALEALKLPRHAVNAFGFAHPLFDPELAPENCTRAQAAIAARFAFENPHHPNPWEHLQ